MSRSSILNVTFDCSDTESAARFWSDVTRWRLSKEDMPGNPFWLVSPDGDASPRLVFVEVPEPKRAKNRVHLDLLPLTDLRIRKLPESKRWALASWMTAAEPLLVDGS